MEAASSIKNNVLGKYKTNKSGINTSSSTKVPTSAAVIQDDDVQEIAHYTPYTAHQIHTKVKERITKTTTIRNGENVEPITYVYDATSYELPVTTPISITEIHNQAKEKLKKKNNVDSVSKVTAGNNKAVSKYQRLSLSSYSKKASVPSTTKTDEPSSITNSEIDLLSTKIKRDSSPEIEIIAVKTPEQGSLVQMPTRKNSSSPPPPSTKNKSDSPSSSNIELLEGPKCKYTADQVVTTKADDSRGLNKPKSVTLVNKTSTFLTTKASPLSSAPLKSHIGHLVDLSSAPSPSFVSVPSTSQNAPWTPQRLNSSTPQKTTPSKVTSPFQQNSTPKRGIKRLLQDSDNEPESKRPPVTPEKTIKENEAVSKYEYLRIFKLLLTEVWSCEQNMPLFDASDLQIFSLFMALSEGAKALYVQLLKMKLQWRRVSTLKYDDISPDLLPFIKELVVQDFLEDTNKLSDLRDMLEMLSLLELKSLLQAFQLPVVGRKKNLIDHILAYGRSQRSILPSTKGSPVKNNLNSVIIERVKSMLGPCVQPSQACADAIMRVCLLGSLPSCLSDESLNPLIFRIYRAVNNHVIFPTFQQHRARFVFKNKKCLLKFQRAHKMLLDVNRFSEVKNWDDIVRIAQDAWIMFKEIQNDGEIREHDTNLPHFLRRFTAGNVLASVLKSGLEAMGRRKQYAVIIELLRDLLGQRVYKTRHRGDWYERLALMLHSHLRKSDEAAEAVVNGMEDPEVHVVSKLGLAQRASQLLSRKGWKPKAEVKQKLTELAASDLVCQMPSVKIRARSQEGQGVGFKRNYFLEDAADGEMIIASVEELAISYYKRNEGYTDGIHSEGRIIIALFGILFWDVIYDYFVPDVFLSKYQEWPLDLGTKEFYSHRESAIEKRLFEMQQWSDDEAQVFLQGMWEQHCGKMSLVPWSIFRDCQQAQNLLLCIGMNTMAGICKRLCLEYRVACSGFPDIVVWKPGLLKMCKFVEVKGPNDKLSSRQKVWIDFLVKLGAQVEVCYVQTVSAKYLGSVNQ